MATSEPIIILQQFQQLQDAIARSHQEFQAHKSPQAIFEGKMAIVKGQIAEAWHIYPSSSPQSQAQLQEKIVNYGRQLEKLEVEHRTGFDSADDLYRHQMNIIWERLCQELLTIPLARSTIRTILTENPDGTTSYDESMDAQKEPEPMAWAALNGQSNTEDCEVEPIINSAVIRRKRSLDLTTGPRLKKKRRVDDAQGRHTFDIATERAWLLKVHEGHSPKPEGLYLTLGKDTVDFLQMILLFVKARLQNASMSIASQCPLLRQNALPFYECNPPKFPSEGPVVLRIASLEDDAHVIPNRPYLVPHTDQINVQNLTISGVQSGTLWTQPSFIPPLCILIEKWTERSQRGNNREHALKLFNTVFGSDISTDAGLDFPRTSSKKMHQLLVEAGIHEGPVGGDDPLAPDEITQPKPVYSARAGRAEPLQTQASSTFFRGSGLVSVMEYVDGACLEKLTDMQMSVFDHVDEHTTPLSNRQVLRKRQGRRSSLANQVSHEEENPRPIEPSLGCQTSRSFLQTPRRQSRPSNNSEIGLAANINEPEHDLRTEAVKYCNTGTNFRHRRAIGAPRHKSGTETTNIGRDANSLGSLSRGTVTAPRSGSQAASNVQEMPMPMSMLTTLGGSSVHPECGECRDSEANGRENDFSKLKQAGGTSLPLRISTISKHLGSAPTMPQQDSSRTIPEDASTPQVGDVQTAQVGYLVEPSGLKLQGRAEVAKMTHDDFPFILELPHVGFLEERRQQQPNQHQVREASEMNSSPDSKSRNPASFMGEDERFHCPYCPKSLKNLKWFMKHLDRHSEWRR
ncbi:hypothetical protein HIM_11114 [Hirsutella minnesotensis 3608]|uniref:C2H2-type domain-containing protein n=1 Tax=Hirsutella minnesotensis 3608 TaxID=1043627 RepID=A0A0F7ZWS8_9HYPO|nr:hypothetical protein HIM_11114 [Hirsutella minnesotensis 3608]